MGEEIDSNEKTSGKRKRVYVKKTKNEKEIDKYLKSVEKEIAKKKKPKVTRKRK